MNFESPETAYGVNARVPQAGMPVVLQMPYNGNRFDLPFLRRRFGLELAQPHLDLMVSLRGLGYRGGLKVCEQRAGFRRQYSGGTDGADAVCLWYAWCCRHDADSLRKLIVYNLEDTFSMAWLAARVVPRSMPGYPHPIRAGDPPPPPDCRDVLANFGL